MRKMQNGIWKHLKKEPPKVLYHYTSLSNFLSIVRSRELYATDISYLNDLQEYRHARALIAKRIEQRVSNSTGEVCDPAALRWHLDLLKKEQTEPVYVSSFSEKEDDLSQWRGYVPAGAGICIGFDSGALRQAVGAVKCTDVLAARFGALGKVVYVTDDEGPSFDDFNTSACGYLDLIDGEVVRAVAAEGLVNHGTPFYKHYAFKDEAEWRIVLWTEIRSDFKLEIDFRMGLSTLVPFTKLSFGSVGPPFIKKVILGPSPNLELSLKATSEFF